jgi:hypothetical protein
MEPGREGGSCSAQPGSDTIGSHATVTVYGTTRGELILLQFIAVRIDLGFITCPIESA